jgi:hypothetical protein
LEADPRWPSTWHQSPCDSIWKSILGSTPFTGWTKPLSFFGRREIIPGFPVTKEKLEGIHLNYSYFGVILYALLCETLPYDDKHVEMNF